MAKFATDAIGAMLLSNLVQVTESISGSVVPLAMFLIMSLKKIDFWGGICCDFCVTLAALFTWSFHLNQEVPIKFQGLSSN